MDIWSAKTYWDRPDLDLTDVAAWVELQPSTIKQLLNQRKFPEPAGKEGTRNQWSEAQIFGYMIERRPHLIGKIPRLFPRVLAPQPAMFVEAREIRLADGGVSYVAYEFLPGDGAGPVFLAFPIADVSYSLSPRRAAQLFRTLGATVAIPTGDSNTVRGERQWQPAIWVVDGTRPADTPAHGVKIYGWLDLANLTRIGLPWWPSSLRRGTAMLKWRPGAPTAMVKPFRADFDPQRLLDIVTTSTPAVVRDAIAQKVHWLRYDLVSGDRNNDGSDYYPERPGCIHAARPAGVEFGTQRCDWTPDQAMAILRHRVPDRAAARAALPLIGDIWPHAVQVLKVRPDGDPLATEWARRLQPCGQHDDLGFHYVIYHAELREDQIAGYLSDPLNPTCRAVRDSQGVVHASVGTSVPATGQLTEVTLNDGQAFFRDDTHAWPMPYPGHGGYNTGYQGGGPQDFLKAITHLCADAAADVSPYLPIDTSSVLWSQISTQHQPFAWTRT